MDNNIEDIIEKLENIKRSLENETNYAVMWLGETIDFLNNDDLNMAVWSYSKYLEVFQRIDIDFIKNSGLSINNQLKEITENASSIERT